VTLFDTDAAESSPGGGEASRARSARANLPVWLRKPPSSTKSKSLPPSPREFRWWAGVVWLALSALLLGFVAHVSLVGSLQHSRAQYVLYQELRTSLALATTPLGQLDVDGALVENGTPIGVMTIEKLGVNEVIVQGTLGSDLMNGPGHRRDTVLPGQEGTSILMGRQATYGGPFSLLSGLVPGDEIEIVTGQGTSTYEVFGLRQEGDLLPQALAEGEGRLELVTADGIPLAPSGSLYVDAALTSTVQDTPSPVFTAVVLDDAEFPMGSDLSGWFATLFWFQWLAVAVIALRWIRARWGVWQTWVVAVPVLLALGAATAGAAMTMLPNLL
jgi:sortase A